jgi:HEAT repeat protein
MELRWLLDNLKSKSSTAGVRSNAAYSLGELGAEEASHHLIAALQDASFRVRKSAAKALGMLGAADAVPHLIASLEDVSFRVRKSAIRSLAQIGGSEALGYVEKAVSDSDPVVAFEARTALDTFNGK